MLTRKGSKVWLEWNLTCCWLELSKVTKLSTGLKKTNIMTQRELKYVSKRTKVCLKDKLSFDLEGKKVWLRPFGFKVWLEGI